MPISQLARQAAYAVDAERQTYLDLITITHPKMTTLRFVNNTSDVISNGALFVAAPFKAEFPPQAEGAEATVTVTVANVDGSIEAAIAGLNGEPNFRIECVLSTSLDTPRIGPYDLPLRSSVTTRETIVMTLGGQLQLLGKLFPRARFSQEDFPALDAT